MVAIELTLGEAHQNAEESMSNAYKFVQRVFTEDVVVKDILKNGFLLCL